jgi:hypothetical protein
MPPELIRMKAQERARDSPMSTLDLSQLPSELTDYAFDQFDDRARPDTPEWEEAVESVLAEEPVELDYHEQQVNVHQHVLIKIIEQAVREQLNHIQLEVNRGERDDFTEEELTCIRRSLDQVFNWE